METLNMTDNLLLRWWKPFRVGPRRRGAAFLLSPNPTGLRSPRLGGDKQDPVVQFPKSQTKGE